MREFYARHKELVDKLVFIVAIAAAMYIFIKYLFSYVAPFCFALLFSLATEPLIRFMNKKLKIGRGLAAFFCLIIALLLIFVVGATLVLKLWREAQAYAANLPRYINELTAAIDRIKIYFSNVFIMIPVDFGDFGLNPRNFGPEIASFLSSGVKNSSVVIVSSVPIVLINIVLFLISSFFFIKDKDFIRKVILENSPPSMARHYVALKRGLFTAFGGYLKAQFTIMCVIAIMNITALLAIRYPYALMMGLFIAFLEALPFIGSGFILWPWAVISLISGNYSQTVALGVLYVANILARQFLEPRLLSTHIGLYPLVTLISMYAGLKIFGVLGFIIGPLIVICIKIILTNLEQPETKPAGGSREIS